MKMNSSRSSTSQAGDLLGKRVEVDRNKQAEALKFWKRTGRQARDGCFSFFEGMRLLAGVPAGADTAHAESESARAWTGIPAAKDLKKLPGKPRPSQLGCNGRSGSAE